MDESIIVSVHTLVYNHEKYIAKAIESVLAQQCNFKIEMIVSDDCSPDGSAAIIRDYASRYPDIIKPIFNAKNIGAAANNLQVLRACKGKYIAALEGDDYWCDPYKLQKQIDFLEANPDFSMCFTDAGIVDEISPGEFVVSAESFFTRKDKDVYDMADFIMANANIIPTPTFIFRNQLPDPMPDCFCKTVSGDIILQFLMADKGKAKFLPDRTAMYRHHTGGITKVDEEIKKAYDDLVMIYASLDSFFNFKYKELFRTRQLAVAKERLIYGAEKKKGMERVRHYMKRMPDYMKYSNGINIKELMYYHLVLFAPSLLKMKKKG